MILELPHSLRRLPALLALALLPVLLVIGTAAPALAHDHLVSSDPEDGAQLEASPEAITLTFSADVMDVSPVVRIVDAQEQTVLEETPTIEGTAATLTLEEPLPAGDYTVQWRVVSSDGHPIEGTFAISVEGGTVAEDPSASATPGEEASAAGTTAEAPPSSESAAPADSAPDAGEGTEEGNDALVPVFIGLGVIVVIGGVIALRAGRSGRR